MIRFYLGCTLLIFPATVLARGTGLMLAFVGVPFAAIVYVISILVFHAIAKIVVAEKTTRIGFWFFAVIGLPIWIVIYAVSSAFMMDSVPDSIMGFSSEGFLSFSNAFLFPIILFGFYKFKYRSGAAK